MAKMKSYLDDIKEISNVSLPWEKLDGANILITGATGLIGSTMVEALMENPWLNCCVYASGRSVKRVCERFRNYIDKESFHLNP